MKKSLYLTAIGAALTAALAFGPATASADNTVPVETHHHHTFRPIRGTVNAVRTTGSAVGYGAREVGQSVSGRQGRPSSEAASERDRARMEHNAERTRQDFGGRVKEPAPKNHTHTHDQQASSVRTYRDNVGGGPNEGVAVRTDNSGVKGDVGVKTNHDNINGTREFREGGRSLVHGTGNAIRAGGNAVAYGARELGQTISGRQGNPAGEAASARERQRMHQEAGQSRQDMHNLGTHTENVGRDITH